MHPFRMRVIFFEEFLKANLPKETVVEWDYAEMLSYRQSPLRTRL